MLHTTASDACLNIRLVRDRAYFKRNATANGAVIDMYTYMSATNTTSVLIQGDRKRSSGEHRKRQGFAVPRCHATCMAKQNERKMLLCAPHPKGPKGKESQMVVEPGAWERVVASEPFIIHVVKCKGDRDGGVDRTCIVGEVRHATPVVLRRARFSVRKQSDLRMRMSVPRHAAVRNITLCRLFRDIDLERTWPWFRAELETNTTNCYSNAHLRYVAQWVDRHLLVHIRLGSTPYMPFFVQVFFSIFLRRADFSAAGRKVGNGNGLVQNVSSKRTGLSGRPRKKHERFSAIRRERQKFWLYCGGVHRR